MWPGVTTMPFFQIFFNFGFLKVLVPMWPPLDLMWFPFILFSRSFPHTFPEGTKQGKREGDFFSLQSEREDEANLQGRKSRSDRKSRGCCRRKERGEWMAEGQVCGRGRSMVFVAGQMFHYKSGRKCWIARENIIITMYTTFTSNYEHNWTSIMEKKHIAHW